MFRVVKGQTGIQVKAFKVKLDRNLQSLILRYLSSLQATISNIATSVICVLNSSNFCNELQYLATSITELFDIPEPPSIKLSNFVHLCAIGFTPSSLTSLR